MSAWDALKRDIDLNWPDETPNEHYDGVMVLLNEHRPAIEAEARADALDVEVLAEAIKRFNADPLTAYLVDITYAKHARAIAAEYRAALDAAREDGA